LTDQLPATGTWTVDPRHSAVGFKVKLVDGRLNLGWDVRLEFALELSTPVEG
jgi:polyisoprenoid-binding protein YceI